VAVFNEKCGNHKFKINDVDHEPPHCHANIGGRNTQIDLYTFAVLNPPPHKLPPAVRRCMSKLQEAMIEAWDQVIVS